MYVYNLLYILIMIELLLILYLMVFNQYKKNESFNNLFTDDICCTQNEMNNCYKYGKTGVCNYYKNNKSCLCQNSF